MKKSHIATLLIFLLVIPATLYFGLRLTGRAYYLTSTLVIIEIIIPFLLAFESRRPQARELVVIAVLSALAVPRGWLYRFPISRRSLPSLCFRVSPLARRRAFWWARYPPLPATSFMGREPIPHGRCSPTARGECWRASCSPRAGCRKSAGSWPRSAFWPVSCLSAHCWTPARYF